VWTGKFPVSYPPQQVSRVKQRRVAPEDLLLLLGKWTADMSENMGSSSDAPPEEERLHEQGAGSRLQGLQRGVWQGIQEAKCSGTACVRKLVELVQGRAAVLPDEPLWMLGTCYGVTDQEGQREMLPPEILEAFGRDFASRVWCTYRKNFPSLGESLLTSDVGWGCTLRSGQMLVAEALSRHVLGRCWMRDPSQADPRMLSLLSQLSDSPSAPLSIHQLCAAGANHGIQPGKWLGPWVLCKALGALFSRAQPWGLSVHVVCDPSGGGAPALDMRHVRSLLPQPSPPPPPPPLSPTTTGLASVAASVEAAAASAQGGALLPLAPAHAAVGSIRRGEGESSTQAHEQQSLRTPRGVRSTGPEESAEGQRALASLQSDENAGANSCAGGEAAATPAPEHSQATAQGGQAAFACPFSASDQEGPIKRGQDAECACTALEEARNQTGQHSGDACFQQDGARGFDSRQLPDSQCQAPLQIQAQQTQQQQPHRPGLLLLVPLTLGVDKVNSLYYPQLQQILTFPQSVGIVGGRPSSSLYFLGFQGQHLLYLDPHHVQPAAPLPEASSSYFTDSVQLLPISSMDPSIAMGFYCQHAGDLEDLCSRLTHLASIHHAAPLLTVDSSGRQASDVKLIDMFSEGLDCGSDLGNRQHEGWEVL